MSDRRSQRIRENFKQHPNPRSRTNAEPLPFIEQVRRVYVPPTTHPAAQDQHGQLARQLAAQRKGRR